MSGETILVTGATGNQGGAAARSLLRSGGSVRALTRSPEGAPARELAGLGVEVVTGDLDDDESVARAVEGASGVFGVQNFWEHGAEGEVRQGSALIDAAKRAGVRRFVYSSVGGADREHGLSHFASKWAIENHLRDSGIPATIVRPVFLMENLNAPHYRGAILGGTLALALQPEVKLQLIACSDIGDFAAAAFTDPELFAGEAVEFAGDELTGPELAEQLGHAIRRPVRFVTAPIERIRAMKAEVAEMFEWLNEDGYRADLASLRELMPGLRTFADWLRETDWAHAAAESAGK